MNSASSATASAGDGRWMKRRICNLLIVVLTESVSCWSRAGPAFPSGSPTGWFHNSCRSAVGVEPLEVVANTAAVAAWAGGVVAGRLAVDRRAGVIEECVRASTAVLASGEPAGAHDRFVELERRPRRRVP